MLTTFSLRAGRLRRAIRSCSETPCALSFPRVLPRLPHVVGNLRRSHRNTPSRRIRSPSDQARPLIPCLRTTGPAPATLRVASARPLEKDTFRYKTNRILARPPVDVARQTGHVGWRTAFLGHPSSRRPSMLFLIHAAEGAGRPHPSLPFSAHPTHRLSFPRRPPPRSPCIHYQGEGIRRAAGSASALLRHVGRTPFSSFRQIPLFFFFASSRTKADVRIYSLAG